MLFLKGIKWFETQLTKKVMNRIPTFVVVGNAGTRKSTLCHTLSSTKNFKESNSINKRDNRNSRKF